MPKSGLVSSNIYAAFCACSRTQHQKDFILRYDKHASGPISRNGFAKTYARKILRDAADKRISLFLPSVYVLTPLVICGNQPNQFVLEIDDGNSELYLGQYQHRTAIQRHRYSLWETCPNRLQAFFNLDFNTYCQFYGITETDTLVLARMRWC